MFDFSANLSKLIFSQAHSDLHVNPREKAKLFYPKVDHLHNSAWWEMRYSFSGPIFKKIVDVVLFSFIFLLSIVNHITT